MTGSISNGDCTRRSFLTLAGMGALAFGSVRKAFGAKESEGSTGEIIAGFEETQSNTDMEKKWVQKYQRKVRVGIAGFGACKFGAGFGFQDHPNVDVVAVTDLLPDRCAALADVCRCEKTYPSLEEMVKDPKIEAVFVATDAPSHARHTIEAMNHGKHVASACPAVYGNLEDADRLLETVKKTGLKYMMYETTSFRNSTYAMRQIYLAGGFGDIIYSEGEYYHYFGVPMASYKDWRAGLPPMWYPTHSTGYYITVTEGTLTEVSCMGKPSILEHLTPSNNVYNNPFGTEIALFRTSDGGMSRVAVSWDTPGKGGEIGRVRGQKGSFDGAYTGLVETLPDLAKPPLPESVAPGGHGGSHGYLTDEFIMSIMEDRKPLVDIAMSLNMTVPGIVAHESALKDGETMKVPQYRFSG